MDIIPKLQKSVTYKTTTSGTLWRTSRADVTIRDLGDMDHTTADRMGMGMGPRKEKQVGTYGAWKASGIPPQWKVGAWPRGNRKPSGRTEKIDGHLQRWR